MRCPHCKVPIGNYSITCPNCYRSLYNVSRLPEKNLRAEKSDCFQPSAVTYLDEKTKTVCLSVGCIYKENEAFIVLAQSFSHSEDDNISWVNEADFIVIPKKFIKKIDRLLGAKP